MQIGFMILGVVFSLIGIAFIILAIFIKQKSKPFFDHSLPAEGTVIDLGIRQPRTFKMRRFSDPAYTQVTIEFLTNNNQLIQGEINNEVNLFYSGQYKKGDKINLLYNADKPTEFIVTSLQSTNIARLIMGVTGAFLLLTGIGMILLINFLNLFNK